MRHLPKFGNTSRILVVDDEKYIVNVIGKGLEDNGFEVDAFTDPRKALSNFKTGIYDLLILDIRMPGMSGIQLFKEMRKIDDTVKVIFLTSFEIQEKEWRMVLPSTEVNGFIKKSVATKRLMKVISEIIWDT